MIRILGAICLAAGPILLGLRAAGALGARTRALEALAAGLELMERELALRLTPLPQLMAELAARTDPPAKGLFLACGQALEALERERFASAWQRLTQQLDGVPEQACRALAPLGEVLGRYDGAGQCEAIAGVRRELEGLRVRAEEERLRLGRVYGALGVTAGAFLVILFI